ncbi:YuzD family protein [Falsibacillus albus]|uniref:DUF1462 family protein n=1 Tax=Falsibacillus albus TaxID=2478915 RepID=A0A3L7K2G7_9BACI|nr:YuzD family protein [Falsibacillus albus]RLQ96529.1 DUF1462 family protein [Falsibacillus albus]
MRKEIEIQIYGAEVICASCVNLPSSKDTYEWLQAAISRRYPNQTFKIRYIDINNPPEEDGLKDFALRVVDEDMFFPVVLVEGVIVGEGNPKLKAVYEEFEKYGYTAG